MNLYQSKIIEFSDSPYNQQVVSNKLYFINGESLLTLENGRPEEVVHFQGLDSFCPGLDGIWLTRSSDFLQDGEPKSKYININNLVNPYDKFDLNTSSNTIFVDNVCVGWDQSQLMLYVKDFSNDGLYTLKGARRKRYANNHTDGNHIFSREGLDDIICFDMALNELWRVKNDRMNYSMSTDDSPQLYKNTVIYNIGPDRKTRKDFEIAAFAKKDGLVVWKRTLAVDVVSSNLYGDRIYIMMDRRMIVLEAATGNTLVDEPTGFEPERQIALYTDGTQLIAVNEHDQLIRIFSEDGKTLVQEIKIPDPFTIVSHRKITNHNGKLYFSLTALDSSFKGAVYALLELTPCANDEAPTISIDPRPPFVIYTVENRQGEQHYMASVSHDNLEEVIRYGAITVQEIARSRGVHMFTSEMRNELFNGHIKLYIDASVLPDNAEEKIRAMAERVEAKLKGVDIRSGTGEQSISIEVEMGDGSRLLTE